MFDDESEKINNLFKMLNTQIEVRKELFRNYNGDFQFYCEHSKETVPAMVLVIHGVENFKESFEELDAIFNKVSREGVKYGIYIIATAVSERALRISVRNNFPQVIPLKLNSDIDYNMLLGKKPPVISDIEGRGIVVIEDNLYEFQTASICSEDKLQGYLKQTIELLNKQVPEMATRIKILPTHIYWDTILRGEIDLRKMPIGIECETLNTAFYDFSKNLIHLFSAIDVEGLMQFGKQVITKLKESTYFDTILIDENKLLGEATSIDFNSLNDRIFNATRDRELLIVISGVDKWMMKLDSSVKNDLVNWFGKVYELNNCRFLIIDRLDDIKSFAYEKWFKQFVSTDYSLFIGRGIHTSTIYNLITPVRSGDAMIPNNYGFHIKNGFPVKVKLVEGVDNNG